ncbi:hypothetical protein [Roseibium sp.]|uniref:hypothetical protein n=1 Tax=Roseibium sp. TaxID=1936156 RepID=UPI003D0C2B1A
MLDTGLARPPSPTYTAITPVTRAPERNAPAAKTELPAEATVAPATQSEDSQQAATNENRNTSRHESLTPHMDRRHIEDPDSKSFVFVATNMDTGEVVRQVPSETLRRLRAYADTIAQQDASANARTIQRTA